MDVVAEYAFGFSGVGSVVELLNGDLERLRNNERVPLLWRRGRYELMTLLVKR